jgi:sarcosine oxidase/L-pipecolate oxidase
VTASGPEQEYVSSSLANVQAIGTDKVEILNSPEEIGRACGLSPAEKDGSLGTGITGYVNWSSGWADAEGAMRWLRIELEKLDRVKFITATVSRLLIDHTTNTVSGVYIKEPTSTSTSKLTADLTILAAGAWTPSLLDLRGICKSTGQTLVYISLSAQDQTAFRKSPTILNLTSGLFIIPPSHRVLKIARHGHGYTNPTTIPHPEKEDEENITVSLPYTHVDDPLQEVPHEAKQSLRDFLAQLYPSLCHSRFVKQKICWYTDTRSGDFLISYHPQYKGLFVATGGSGHAFKFLPVIGDSIVECVLGNTPEDFRGKWEWPAERVPEELWEGDGSRGGPVGMVLSEEMAKTHSSKL